MTTHDRVAPESLGVAALFDASPALEVHTSAAAMTAFICGLGALLAAPFTLTFSIALGLGLLGCCTAIGGVVATSRSRVAGRALAPAGLFFSLVALAVVGLRYANLDTAFGDQLVATLHALLDQLNTLLRMP